MDILLARQLHDNKLYTLQASCYHVAMVNQNVAVTHRCNHVQCAHAILGFIIIQT